MAWYDRYIERVPGVQGGEPVIAGTRTPVRAIAEIYDDVAPRDICEVLRALPHLTTEQVEAALSYYWENRTEIQGNVHRHRAALSKVLAR